MDISQVARQSGLPASTLRYYEEKGLIRSIGRTGLKRTFSPTVLDQLSLISLGRSAGFSLDEIAGMFSSGGRLRIRRQLLSDKADELDRKIRKLTTMRDGLRHAAVCPAPSHLECPKFRRLMKLSTQNLRAHRKKPARRSGA